MTRAIVYSSLGGPEVLTVAEIPEPAAAPGELVVRVEAVGVNPLDGKLRAGVRPGPPFDGPRRMGSDAAGVVAAVGDGVDGYRVGDDVVVTGIPGAYASELAVPAANAVHRPPQVSPAQGAAIGIPAGTAYQTLRSLDVRAGDTLLVHAGSGAVGQAVVQFAVLWGASVIATASPRRFERMRELGATPVAYGEGLVDRVRAAAPHGVTVIVDAAGTDEALDASAELLADRSRIATLVRGRDAAGRGIRAFSGGSPEPLTPQQLSWRAEAIPVTLALMAVDRFSVELGPRFALDDAADAHRALADGVDGKIVLIP